jgi:hypothetical protein
MIDIIILAAIAVALIYGHIKIKKAKKCSSYYQLKRSLKN